MQSSQDGYLLIADITGYTSFLRESELEHAKDSLRSLLDLLIEHTKPPLVISRLEGDAVISYAPAGSFLQGQTLVELIEGTYVDFRRALDLMVLNTSCNCLACRNIGNLDLKFFVHYGTFVLEPLPAYTELIGTDVNLIHRLTKNSVTEKTGYHAYVMYTGAALEHLGIPEMFEQLTPHTERYEDVGEVQSYLFDMHPIWEIRKHRYHTVVKPEDAEYKLDQDFPLPPAILWEYLTEPQFRSILFAADSQKLEDLKGGRISDGSVYICAHGNNLSTHTIVDWHPFEQYTIQSTAPGGYTSLMTILLAGHENHTTASILLGELQDTPRIVKKMLGIFAQRSLIPTLRAGLETLGERVEADINQGKVAQPPAIEVPIEQIETALADSLAQT
jgi:hypothetical protein